MGEVQVTNKIRNTSVSAIIFFIKNWKNFAGPRKEPNLHQKMEIIFLNFSTI